MKIKRFEVFEKFTQDEADELKSLFYSIIDTVGDTYQVRSDDKILDDRHQKILRYDTEITKSGNFIIRIYCDYLWRYQIEKEIREDIIPRIKSLDYKVSIKMEETSERIYRKVPVHGTDRTSIVSDPVVRISVLVKN